MARRKQQALEVPVTADEARDLMEDYVEAERAILAARLGAQILIDNIARERDATLAGLAAANETRFRSLKAWWEAGGKEIAGRGKSAELAGARIGIRLTPPRVKFGRGVKAAGVIAWLKGLRWTRKSEFLRTKVELDRQAVIKAVLAEERVRDTFTGMLSVVQDDEFFIDAGLDEDAMKKALAAAAENET